MKKYLSLLVLTLLTASGAQAYHFAAVNDDGVTIYYKYNGTFNPTTPAVVVTYKESGTQTYTGDVNIPYDVKDSEVSAVL